MTQGHGWNSIESLSYIGLGKRVYAINHRQVLGSFSNRSEYEEKLRCHHFSHDNGTFTTH